jgi:glycosyltransferase involved in cell wall biosynthesis
LFPIDWPEPFGLVMIEAMACGTPVIAWEGGAVAEVVEHGVTGLVVRSEAEAVEAVRNVHTLDRRHIRQEFERRFSSQTMASNYVELYAHIADQPGLDRPVMEPA